MKNILINASNLHKGGAVAVASSFIKELSYLSLPDLCISLLISTEVSENISSTNINLDCFNRISVKNYYGLSALWNNLRADLKGYDVVFTVFGPAYMFPSIPNHLVGFAQPNIIYPKNPIFKSLSFFKQFSTRVKYLSQEYFFSNASELVVELEHVKKGVIDRNFFRKKKIHIVYSAVDSIYRNSDNWETVQIAKSNNIKLGIISRNYPHKNLKVLPHVKSILASEFNLDVDIYVTFTQEEFLGCDDYFKENIYNIGPLKLSQCPSFYNELDGVIFPSLLECFSAVPIETMMQKKPLFASDLPFIRDCCKEHAIYFDPLDPMNIASAISTFYKKTIVERSQHTLDASDFVNMYPNSNMRALSYLEIIKNIH